MKFMHPSSHVDALLHTALASCPEGSVIWGHHDIPRILTAESASRVGRVLLTANAESVNRDSSLSSLGSGLGTEGVFTYFEYLEEAGSYAYHTHVDRPLLSPGQALGGLASFARQCEALPNWEWSEAKAIATAMGEAFVRQLPGFDDHSSFRYPLPESAVSPTSSVLEEF